MILEIKLKAILLDKDLLVVKTGQAKGLFEDKEHMLT